jgi:hypothetical protein
MDFESLTVYNLLVVNINNKGERGDEISGNVVGN